MKLFTIKTDYSNELNRKKSRFIASLHPVQNEESAKDALSRIKHEHRNATHHPYAFRIGFEHMRERSADDGEPPKSSGLPILQELQKACLTNILLVVTRYFGGTKLGLGGLSRAYRESAEHVITTAEKIAAVAMQRLEVLCDQKTAGKLRNLLERYDASILKQTYGTRAYYLIEVERKQCESCTEAINTLTKGEAEIVRVPMTDQP